MAASANTNPSEKGVGREMVEAISSEMSPEEEKLIIRDIMASEAQMKEGDTFYLISQRWWQDWLEFVNQNHKVNTNEGPSSEHQDLSGLSTLKRPSSIDNSDLIYEAASDDSTMRIELHDSTMGIELRDNLVEGTDYILLPEEVWNQLYTWYGGGPTLARKVINSGLSQTELSVEVYPLRLTLHLMPNMFDDEVSAIRISKKETIRELRRRACEIFDLVPEQVFIWDYFNHREHALMNDLDKTLEDANIQMDDDIFLLQGTFMFGPDVRSLVLLTIFLIVAPVAIFCVFVARKLMDDFSDHWGISVMVVAVLFTIYDLVLLLLTSGRDPGIIPPNAHPPEPEGYDGNAEGAGQTPQLHRIKEVEVNGIPVKIKYCDTCMLYGPPRCAHCSICNNCVERFDHHSFLVGQCIGLRNYRFFFLFVFSTTLLCIYVFSFCWVYIRKIMNSEDITIWKAMIKTPASIVLIVYCFISVWYVGGLTAFHLYLISTNQTSYENFRYRYNRRANPYNKGVTKNFGEIFCTSIPPSKKKFRAYVAEEPGAPTRNIAGGFVSPNMGKAADDIEMGRKAVWGGDGGALGIENQREGQTSDNDGIMNMKEGGV